MNHVSFPGNGSVFSGYSWWRHQMETFSALLAICVGNSPHKGQWRNREACDMRRYRAHYDVSVMCVKSFIDEIFLFRLGLSRTSKP